MTLGSRAVWTLLAAGGLCCHRDGAMEDPASLSTTSPSVDPESGSSTSAADSAYITVQDVQSFCDSLEAEANCGGDYLSLRNAIGMDPFTADTAWPKLWMFCGSHYLIWSDSKRHPSECLPQPECFEVQIIADVGPDGAAKSWTVERTTWEDEGGLCRQWKTVGGQASPELFVAGDRGVEYVEIGFHGASSALPVKSASLADYFPGCK